MYSTVKSGGISKKTLLLNLTLYLVFVTCLVLLKKTITKWLDVQKRTQQKESSIEYPTQPNHDPIPVTMSKRASLKPQTTEKVNDASDLVAIKVNVGKATFIKYSQMTIIC